MNVEVAGRRIALEPSRSIGKGGEADVYDIGNGLALKLFKGPNHPDYAGLPAEQSGARERLAIHQTKLGDFPKGLPARVVEPLELALDGRIVAGYTMRLVPGARPLHWYGQPASRRQGVTAEQIVAILRDLHSTLEGIHRSGVVVGDFNDLNVLVRGHEAHVVDADSFQFGKYRCNVFTDRFVDPLLCDAAASAPLLTRPYGSGSDWYAFAVMAFQGLLTVHPFGGVTRPGCAVTHAARPLARLSVMSPAVVYPKPAIPFDVLPDELLERFRRIFEKDERGMFPRSLLEDLRWTRCLACGAEHARMSCPRCALHGPAGERETVTVRGRVTATRIFRTRGSILHASGAGSAFAWLYHEDGKLLREDGSIVRHGPAAPEMRIRLLGPSTLIGEDGKLFTIRAGRIEGLLTIDSAFDTDGRLRYWTQDGRLMRDGTYGPVHVGDVLAGQTRFWAGPEFGLGFYRAGNVSVAFAFRPDARGLDDSLGLPWPAGQLVDARCVFGERRAWLFLAVHARGAMTHRAILVRKDGAVEAVAEAAAGDGSWLGTLGGKCAAGPHLFAATDSGVVRVEAQNARLAVTRQFPDTEPFVDSGCELLAGPSGLYAVSRQEITHLKIA